MVKETTTTQKSTKKRRREFWASATLHLSVALFWLCSVSWEMNHKVDESRTRSSLLRIFFTTTFSHASFKRRCEVDSVRIEFKEKRESPATNQSAEHDRSLARENFTKKVSLWNIKGNIRKKSSTNTRNMFYIVGLFSLRSHRHCRRRCRLPVFIIIYLYYYIYCTNTIRSLGMAWKWNEQHDTQKISEIVLCCVASYMIKYFYNFLLLLPSVEYYIEWESRYLHNTLFVIHTYRFLLFAMKWYRKGRCTNTLIKPLLPL